MKNSNVLGISKGRNCSIVSLSKSTHFIRKPPVHHAQWLKCISNAALVLNSWKFEWRISHADSLTFCIVYGSVIENNFGCNFLCGFLKIVQLFYLVPFSLADAIEPVCTSYVNACVRWFHSTTSIENKFKLEFFLICLKLKWFNANNFLL